MEIFPYQTIIDMDLCSFVYLLFSIAPLYLCMLLYDVSPFLFQSVIAEVTFFNKETFSRFFDDSMSEKDINWSVVECDYVM